MKVAVLVSGGVDSSVALNLLKEEGHDLTAFYLKIWLEDEMSYMGQCPWKEDLAYVRLICQKLGLPLEVIDMQKEYWDNVVSYTISEAKAGRTPNPDIFCNQQIKFGHFYDKIDDSFEKVATGHYAQICEERTPKNEEQNFLLMRAPDPIKDQTYFLAHLDQKQLSRAMFPIGKYTKKEVRQLAEKFDLPNKNRKDSQGICFLGKIPFRDFIKHHLDKKPGDFINSETGEKIGEHDGYWFYTIGQRQGLGLSGGPWFVTSKDIEKNIIYLSQGYEPEEVYRDNFEVTNLHWISKNFKEVDFNATVKIRHGANINTCSVKFMNKKVIQVKLDEKVHGIAPGQYAVFYDGDVCLGCGMITL
ncbi:tRNA 2-thiouridine(34) synthase MnmA [Candidatus Peregrinibacteria bacterium]|nr:tRNA 2-thiouridine(34) synthase MnmA [Candidatus Peregrinibacteria bacterium]